MALNGLAKLAEELGELQQVIGKVLAYGYGDHPDGTNLRRRMLEEIGDVAAALDFYRMVEFPAGGDEIEGMSGYVPERVFLLERKIYKGKLFREWHADPDNNAEGVKFPDKDSVPEEAGDARVEGSGGVVGPGVISVTFPEDWSAGFVQDPSRIMVTSVSEWFTLESNEAQNLPVGARVFMVQYDRVPFLNAYTMQVFHGAALGDGRFSMHPLEEKLLDIPPNPRELERHYFWRRADAGPSTPQQYRHLTGEIQ